MDFETVEQGYKYKITPLGFISGMLPHYKIIYTFKNTSQISQVGLKLSTETGVIKLDKQSYNNDHLEYHAALGETTVVIVSAQKYKFLKGKGCQYQSPNIILLDKITK